MRRPRVSKRITTALGFTVKNLVGVSARRAGVRELPDKPRLSKKQLEVIINCAAVPVLRSMQDHPPELVTALVPSLVRVMLPAAVEVMADERRRKAG